MLVRLNCTGGAITECPRIVVSFIVTRSQSAAASPHLTMAGKNEVSFYDDQPVECNDDLW